MAYRQQHPDQAGCHRRQKREELSVADFRSGMAGVQLFGQRIGMPICTGAHAAKPGRCHMACAISRAVRAKPACVRECQPRSVRPLPACPMKQNGVACAGGCCLPIFLVPVMALAVVSYVWMHFCTIERSLEERARLSGDVDWCFAAESNSSQADLKPLCNGPLAPVKRSTALCWLRAKPLRVLRNPTALAESAGGGAG